MMRAIMMTLLVLQSMILGWSAQAAGFDHCAGDALLKKHVVSVPSIACPALRPEAYVADHLNAQQEDATRKFLSDRTGHRLDGNTLKVSNIFKWYRTDLEKGWRSADSLGRFLAIYRETLGLDAEAALRLSSSAIAIAIAIDIGFGFLDYDWQLNDN